MTPIPRSDIRNPKPKTRASSWFGPLLMIAPALVVFILFVILPFLGTVRLSFHEWNGFSPTQTWVGLDNFRRLARDATFGHALLNNCIYWWITLFSEVAVGLVLAVLIVRCTRGRTLFRLALSMPLMIALVASAVLWRQLLADNGPVNEIMVRAGLLRAPIIWRDPRLLVVTVSLVSGWAYCGFYMLLFSAALERIPNELREAARVDGASDWQLFWRIELPLLRSIGAVAFLLCTTGAFRAFDLFWVMAGQMVDPAYEVSATYVVKQATLREARGYSAAVAVVVVVLVVVGGYALSRLTARAKELEY